MMKGLAPSGTEHLQLSLNTMGSDADERDHFQTSLEVGAPQMLCKKPCRTGIKCCDTRQASHSFPHLDKPRSLCASGLCDQLSYPGASKLRSVLTELMEVLDIP